MGAGASPCGVWPLHAWCLAVSEILMKVCWIWKTCRISPFVTAGPAVIIWCGGRHVPGAAGALSGSPDRYACLWVNLRALCAEVGGCSPPNSVVYGPGVSLDVPLGVTEGASQDFPRPTLRVCLLATKVPATTFARRRSLPQKSNANRQSPTAGLMLTRSEAVWRAGETMVPVADVWWSLGPLPCGFYGGLEGCLPCFAVGQILTLESGSPALWVLRRFRGLPPLFAVGQVLTLPCGRGVRGLADMPLHSVCPHATFPNAGRSDSAQRQWCLQPWSVHGCEWHSADARELLDRVHCCCT